MDRRTTLLSGLLVVTFTATACACLWDYDTLQMERLRFPGALEIITGKFVRHSRAYYEWRIIDRKKKLETREGDPALLDDLAVAYAKLGRPEEGIALLEPTLATRPDRYETLSNLGTLLFFAGRLEDSKQYIRRALEINPDAHFGREKYQLLLTEYVQPSKRDELGVLSDEPRYPIQEPIGFAKYVLEAKFGASQATGVDVPHSPEQLTELRAATRGVLGMMHFADYQSPILLEALGDLLITGNMEQNNMQLAARAYLRAAAVTKDPAVAKRYREMSEYAIGNSIDFREGGPQGKGAKFNLQTELSKEVASADSWFATIEAKEKAWIAASRDVDREFAAVYYDSLERTVAAAEKQLQSEPKDRRLTKREADDRSVFLIGAVCVGTPLALIGLGIASIVWWHGRARAREKQVLKTKSAPLDVGPNG